MAPKMSATLTFGQQSGESLSEATPFGHASNKSNTIVIFYLRIEILRKIFTVLALQYLTSSR